MTDIGACQQQPPAGGMRITSSGDSAALLMSSAPTNSAAVNSGSLIQANVNGIHYSYAGGLAASTNSGPSSSPDSDITISGTTLSDQQQHQQGMQKKAFIVLPISFRTDKLPQSSSSSQNQQIVSTAGTAVCVSSVAAAVSVSPVSTMKGNSQQSMDSSHARQLPTDQIVSSAVNWIVHDAKQRQMQQHCRMPVQQHMQQQQQQIYHQNNGKLHGQLLSPAVPESKRLFDNSRKFSTSAVAHQHERRYIPCDAPSTVSHSEPTTPHGYYSPSDSVAVPKVHPGSPSVRSEAGLVRYVGGTDQMNGVASSPAAVNDITVGIQSDPNAWSRPQSHSSFVGIEEIRRTDSGGHVIPDGVYPEPDLALSNRNSFPVSGVDPDSLLIKAENGTFQHHIPSAAFPSAALISPSASTVSETASSGTPPVTATNGRPAQQKPSGGGKSGKGSGGGGAFCAFEERQCKQRCINGYRHCIRHILCDPNSPYRPCNYVKKQGTKEIRCSNAVALSQGSEYCSTHLIMMGMKEAKRRKVPTPAVQPSVAGNVQMNGVHGTPSAISGQTSGSKKKKSPAKKQQQPAKPVEDGSRPSPQGPSNFYGHAGHGTEQGRFGSGVQYSQQHDQQVYHHHYGQQPRSPKPYMNNGDVGNTGRTVCSELPSTSTPANNGVAFRGGEYVQQHDSHQLHPVEGEFRRPYFVNQQQFGMGYQDSYQQQQLHCPPMPQSVYVPQQHEQRDFTMERQQTQQPAPPGSYTSGQAGPAPLQSVYDQQPQLHDAVVYGHPYAPVHQQPMPTNLQPVQQAQHPQSQGEHSFDQISMSHPQPTLMPPGRPNSVVGSGQQRYGDVSNQYVPTVPACTSSDDHGNNSVWKMSSMTYNGPIASPQKPAVSCPGQVFVVYQNGESGNGSDVVRSHPELAAQLLPSSGSGGTSPQSRGLSSGGSGNGSTPGFVQHAPNQPQQLSHPSTFQPHQHTVDAFDDSIQGFNTAAGTDSSYLLCGDDPFLGAQSSSGFSRDGTVTGLAIGAVPRMGTTTMMMSPESSEISDASSRSYAVLSASTTSNAGVGLCSVSSGQQQTKQVMPNYAYQQGTVPSRVVCDYQSGHGGVAQSLVASTQERRPDTSTGIEGGQKESTTRTNAPVVPSQPAAPTANKKVIRLKQKKRHGRMYGAYRQIPAVGHMCKVLEDLDFYRKDLFPLGLEPSSSDTDSDEESAADLIQYSLLTQHCVGSILEKGASSKEEGDELHGDHEDIARSSLPKGVVSKAKRQLYLLKKSLRLDENRLRRRVGTESRVIATASRLYPNSVGAALSDRRRHRTGLIRRRISRFPHPPACNDSKKIYTSTNNGRRAAKLKKFPSATVGEADALAELELKRSLATRRCTFETPATLVLVQQTGPNGNVEHRRQVLAQHRCGNRALPYCNYCQAHVLQNDDQQLYRKCAYTDCHRAALDVGVEHISSCLIHQNRRYTQSASGTKMDAVSQSLPSGTDPYIVQHHQDHSGQCQEHLEKTLKGVHKVLKDEGPAEDDTVAGGKRKKRRTNAKMVTRGEADTGSTGIQGEASAIRASADIKKSTRTSASSVTKEDETTGVVQEALTLASVAQNFGFEDHELTEMLIRLPEEAFDGILEPDLARTGPGVITVTDSGGGNEVVNPSAVGVDAVEMAVQAATSSCSHNWADVEQFLLSEGYCGANAAIGVTSGGMAGFISPPPAYTNLTNASASLDPSLHHASAFRPTVQLPHPQPTCISTAGGWPTPLAPIVPVESYVGQHYTPTESSAVVLPGIEAYAQTIATTAPVSSCPNTVNEQSEKVADTSTSWSSK